MMSKKKKKTTKKKIIDVQFVHEMYKYVKQKKSKKRDDATKKGEEQRV